MIPVQEQVTGGYEYLGYARQRLSGLETARLAADAPALSKHIYPANGVEIYIRVSSDGHLIRITEGIGGFICHPRDDTNPGGAKPGGVAVTPTYTYPLVDDDSASRVLTYETDGWIVSSDADNYGNLDWISPDGDVVSWRGPAGRQLVMDSTESYPGFTEWDYTVMSGGLEIEHYTPYRNLVYRGGEVYREFLSGYKVLGCGLCGDSLVCVVGVDYAGIENPDGGTGGFYDEVWVEASRIGWQSSSRPTTPWFFNSAGLEAVNGNQKVTIAENLQSVTFSDLATGTGTQTNEYTGADRGTWGVTRRGSWSGYRDFANLTLQGITLNLSFDEGSHAEADSYDTYADLPIMWSGEPILVGGYPYIGRSYSVENMCPNVEFSGSCLTFSGSVVTEMTDCCEDVTITAQDDHGNTVSASYHKDFNALKVYGNMLAQVNGTYSLVSVITDGDGPVSPVSWSFSAGTIDNTGKITGITTCTSGSDLKAFVTGTDACGRTASMEVVTPGVWVMVAEGMDTIGTCGSGCNVIAYPSIDTMVMGWVGCCEDFDSTHTYGLLTVAAAQSSPCEPPVPFPHHWQPREPSCCTNWWPCRSQSPTRDVTGYYAKFKYVCP